MSVPKTHADMNSGLIGANGDGIISTNKGKVFVAGLTVPTAGTAGYSPGCLFVHADGTTANTVLYRNVSANTSACNFVAFTV